MAVALLLLTAIGEPGEQWNGPASTPRCTDKWQRWTDDFAAGERAIRMYSQSYVCDGNDCDVVGAFSPKYAFQCATKGPGGAGSNLALDPVAQYTMIGVTAEFHSAKPCRFLSELGAPVEEARRLDEGNARRLDVGSGEGGGTGGAAGGAEGGSGEGYQGCIEPAIDACRYPDPPDGLTALPHFSDLQLPDHWPGLLMDMGNLNNADPHLNHESWAPDEEFRHMLPYGVSGSVCDDSSYDAGGNMLSEAGAERAFYDGGVLIEKTRGPVTTRSYIFKNDADRELAKADERNLGLKYAKTFTGENGCDTEVVWEITPQNGGGVEMELTVPLDAASCETEQGLRNAVHVYYTGEEVVVLVTRRALKEAHYLNATCDAGGYKELVRFASSFVCKETGESVSATVKFFNDRDEEYAASQLSTDASNPTPYYTGTGVNYLGQGGRCTEGGISYRPHGSRFQISASAADAPESCGSFYWDPLLQAVPGDGIAWQLVNGAWTSVDMRTPVSADSSESSTTDEGTAASDTASVVRMRPPSKRARRSVHSPHRRCRARARPAFARHSC